MDLDSLNIGDFPDAEIATRMRNTNYEKFKTLVRMHLSFELDLNTDEFDLPCHEIVYEDKGKLKKWNRMSKKHKGGVGSACTSYGKGSASAGNSPTEGLQQQIDSGFLFHLKELKEFLLLEKNLTQEGLFRKTGSASRQNELRLQIQNDKPLDLEGGGYSAHDCATVFKGYLADLPEPLLTDAHYPAHLQIAPLCLGTSVNLSESSSSKRTPNPERLKREQHLLNSMQLLLLLLPDENRQLTQDIIEMLHAVASHADENKMSPDNLATLFAPHLICPRNLPPEALHYVAKKMSSIIAYMIQKGSEIFEVPAKLSTDIRAYFLERKRKKTMSPEHTLDDSISDISTVNTVYTFVDRERTAAAHTANNTDTELAQLYAHIQSLPESSKKRRLIKQFNKQNGQGTPLQLVVMNRLKNSEATRSAKSIGDSIKKHIFHKGIMSRTPKRANVPVPMGFETPNFSNTKNPKLRALFQSPAPSASVSHFSTTSSTSASTGSHSSTTITTISITSSSSTSSAHSSTNSSPFIIKKHPLQKSISSSSLLMNFHLNNSLVRSYQVDGEATNASSSSSSSSSISSDGFSLQSSKTSTSAPVSRQTSSDFHATPQHNSSVSNASSHHFQLLDPNCCVTPLKIISEAAKHLIGVGGAGGGGEKKTVAWDEDHLLDVEEISNPCTPINQSASEFKLRYKSEPNLSRMLKDKVGAEGQNITPICKSKSLTRKLMKGVSMGNLKFPFSTPESTKRLVRSVSSTLKRRSSDDGTSGSNFGLPGAAEPLLEHENDDDLDDDTFEDDPEDHVDDDEDEEDDDDDDAEDDDETEDEIDGVDNGEDASLVAGGGSSSSELPGTSGAYQHMLQNSSVYRNMDLITSTPSLLLGRRSMSPITKSTQRMPKAMQESIMTPRSRKPVMMLTNTLGGSSDQNQTIYQTDLSSFREQDEDSLVAAVAGSAAEFQPIQPLNINEDALDGYTEILHRQRDGPESSGRRSFLPQTSRSANPEESDTTNSNSADPKPDALADALTNNFKEYLLSRSVLTASPVDSSFSSQPDDFHSTREIEDLDESQLSPSLLYCLDGNQPEEAVATEATSKSINATTPLATIDEQQSATTTTATTAAASSRFNRLSTNPFIIVNNARKRAATSDMEKLTKANNSANASDSTPTNSFTENSKTQKTTTTSIAKDSNKENFQNVENYLMSKKLLISEYPGETSF